MKTNFDVSGMSCQSCVDKISKVLAPEFTNFQVSLASPQISIESTEAISEVQINNLLSPLKKYSANLNLGIRQKSQDSFFTVYKPIGLIFIYIILAVGAGEFASGSFDGMRAMSHFMGGFFLFFSFFKLLDVQKFADAYSTYDILARKFRAYGLVYPFIELSFGLAYLSGLQSVSLYTFTLVLMILSLWGVTESLLKKRTIQCACLGTVFNLPMSKVTFFEDALMVLMSVLMILIM